jgi:MFS family permease
VEDKEPATHLKTDSEAMDRLRDRTDELELIISSLTIFALFSVPSWLFDKIADIYTHLSTSLAIASTAGITLLAGTSFGLAACFVVHLMARAYWVGLIGLRTVFPDGINWSKTPSLGPLSRQYFRDTLPDIDTVIQNTDRLASSLFAVISMLTLSVLWFGTILTVILVVSGAVGARFGLTNTGMGIGTAVLLMVFFGIPIIVYLLDRQLASRVPRLRDSRIFASLIRFLSRIAGFAYPQRLVRPVQLTLQSNTRPVAFSRSPESSGISTRLRCRKDSAARTTRTCPVRWIGCAAGPGSTASIKMAALFAYSCRITQCATILCWINSAAAQRKYRTGSPACADYGR